MIYNTTLFSLLTFIVAIGCVAAVMLILALAFGHLIEAIRGRQNQGMGDILFLTGLSIYAFVVLLAVIGKILGF